MTPLRVLLVTDSFPPHAGGSGWSTFTLAQALADLGHHIEVVHVVPGPSSGIEQDTYEGLTVTRWRRHVPNVPVVRNVLKNEWLWADLAEWLATRLRRSPVDVIHAQHVMTGVATVRAALATDVASVVTVRDYWPVCYWSDLIIDAQSPHLCPACTVANRRTCTRNRAGSLGRAAWTLLPYMTRNLAAKQQALAAADRVIGVSTTISADMLARSSGLAAERLVTIPNAVRMDDLAPVSTRPGPPFVLYAGKLATNKGTQFLLPALDNADVTWPLVVVGDGPDRAALEAEAVRRGRTVQWLGWLDRSEVLTLMRQCTLLAFPSYGPESLSRVLIEAAALGTPIAAMQTGGTPDIVTHEITGLLADTPDAFAHALRRLAGDAALRQRLGAAAAAHAHGAFDARVVASRTAETYVEAITTQQKGRRG